MNSKALIGLMVLMPLFLMGCTTGNTVNKMQGVVETGDIVSVEYIGTLDNSEVFDQSAGNPLEFIAGVGQMIKGFDDAVLGMRLNEKKTIHLEPEEAYGYRDETLELELEKNLFPEDFYFGVGEEVPLTNNYGQIFIASIKEVKEETVVLDMNPPLAGKSLNFEITVVKIEKQ
ncbi:MAG: FKBP-type peptidyl-prolyl cis-trans isomerase [Candidatus Nanoarchaeia archaeon]|nr:FKBP-type peptidyl-prolyl cis-trans isomerase [Candidatus Nanoarchaeia archaeon]